MADVLNPFDLLGDDVEDPSQFLAAQEKLDLAVKKASAQPAAKGQAAKPSAKLPSKPLPPAQAVRESRNEGGRGSGRGGGRGRGRGGGRGFNRESTNNENGFSNGYKPLENGDGGKPFERRSGYGGERGSFRGVRRDGEVGEGERPRRQFERRNGTGRGNEFKREGADRTNWGKSSDEPAPASEEPVIENEKKVPEKQAGEEVAKEVNIETPANEPEEKEPEDKEMTLEEYEKILEEKRKALLARKTEERKVDVDREFQSMQPLNKKANDDEVFIKLGSDKEKRKDAAEKEEKAKKVVSINEFLKPADGERYFASGGRGRGRGRGSRSGYGGGNLRNVPAPSIEDPGQFPSLGAK